MCPVFSCIKAPLLPVDPALICFLLCIPHALCPCVVLWSFQSSSVACLTSSLSHTRTCTLFCSCRLFVSLSCFSRCCTDLIVFAASLSSQSSPICSLSARCCVPTLPYACATVWLSGCCHCALRCSKLLLCLHIFRKVLFCPLPYALTRSSCEDILPGFLLCLFTRTGVVFTLWSVG